MDTRITGSSSEGNAPLRRRRTTVTSFLRNTLCPPGEVLTASVPELVERAPAAPAAPAAEDAAVGETGGEELLAREVGVGASQTKSSAATPPLESRDDDDFVSSSFARALSELVREWEGDSLRLLPFALRSAACDSRRICRAVGLRASSTLACSLLIERVEATREDAVACFFVAAFASGVSCRAMISRRLTGSKTPPPLLFPSPLLPP